MREDYDGYLKPYLPVIKELSDNGLNPHQIARSLYDDQGVRSSQDHIGDPVAALAGLVRFIITDRPARSVDRLIARRDWLSKELKKVNIDIRLAKKGRKQALLELLKLGKITEETPLKELHKRRLLSTRSLYTLRHLSAEPDHLRLGDIRHLTDVDLLRQPNFGLKSLQEVRDLLAAASLG